MNLPDPHLRDIHERMIDDYAEGTTRTRTVSATDPDDVPPWVDDHNVMNAYLEDES